jgi:GH18 family chitinase
MKSGLGENCRPRPSPVLIRRFFLSLALLLTLSACAEPSPPAVMPTMTPAPSREFKIVGYFTGGDVVSQIQFDKVTHINYAFLIPRSDGTFESLANTWKLEDVVEQAHQHNVKVLISVGGWGYDAQFEAMAADTAARAAFVDGLTQFVAAYDLDGADIDWEYPDPGDSGRNFISLMRDLRSVLNPKGKLLTAAVVALGATGDGILPDTFEAVDFLNIMAYDGGAGPQHSPYQYAVDALAYWQARGVPVDKTVLGVPFYSRPGEIAYAKLVKDDPGAANSDTISYLGRTEYYNGLPTIQQKTELAMQAASGIMIWTLAHDTTDNTSLLNTIYETAYTAKP